MPFLKGEQCCSPKFFRVLFGPTCIRSYSLISKDGIYHCSFSSSSKNNNKKTLEVVSTFKLYWKPLATVIRTIFSNLRTKRTWPKCGRGYKTSRQRNQLWKESYTNKYYTDEQANTVKQWFGITICSNICFCALEYCVKFDVLSTVLKFDVPSLFAISRPIYEIQKNSIYALHIQILANVYMHAPSKFVSHKINFQGVKFHYWCSHMN